MTQSMNPQGKGERSEHLRPDKGLAFSPITDMQFDVVTIVHAKGKALQAYDKYLRDTQGNDELREILERIKSDDHRHIEELKKFLGNC